MEYELNSTKDETRAILKGIRGNMDYEELNYDERDRIVQTIEDEYGDVVEQRLDECIDGNIKDYNNMYCQIGNVLDTVANYLLFAEGGIEKKRDEDGKEIYPYMSQNIRAVITQRETVSLENYVIQIDSDGEGRLNKNYDDNNVGSHKLKDFGSRADECPYVQDYKDFDKSARVIVKEFNDRRDRSEWIASGLRRCGYHKDAEIVEDESKQIHTESLLIGDEHGIEIHKDFSGLGLKLSNGIFYTEYRIKKLSNGIGFMPNNSREIDKDLIYLLDNHFGFFFFNNPSQGTTVPDWGLANYGDPDVIMELLKYRGSNLSTWRGIFTHDVDQLIEEVCFTDTESKVLELHKNTDMTQEEMGEDIDITQQGAIKALKSACVKITEAHEKNYENWLHFGVGVVKGGFKSCSKCKEVKLVRYFGKDKRAKDGFRSSCKECENRNR